MIRKFRLTNEPGGLGLSCSPAGLALAGVPLLGRTTAGFVPRPPREITALIEAAYGTDVDAMGLRSCLGTIAHALNSEDFGRAAIAAVHTRTPELSREAAARLARAEERLTKYDQDEPRDWHGRWTRFGAAAPPMGAVDVGDEEDSRRPKSLHEALEQEYDHLGPVDFAKRVIQFGDWLGRNGKNLSPSEREWALAEYAFLQDRLSLWLGYDYKPPMAQMNLLSAAQTLFQGAVNGGIVGPGNLPRSMLYVAGTAAVFTGGAPRTRPSKPDVTAEPPGLVEGLGGIVSNSKAKITWWKGIDVQNGEWEDYIASQTPNTKKLVVGATGFDLFNPQTSEAISAKTLNTLSASYVKNPQSIFRKVRDYINDTLDYEPSRDSDLDPAEIQSRTLHLAVSEYTSPTQWRYLLRAIIYGKDNGVSVVITRIRE